MLELLSTYKLKSIALENEHNMDAELQISKKI